MPFYLLILGSAYIFVSSDGIWTYQAYLYPLDGKDSDYFGAAVTIQDNIAAIASVSCDLGAIQDTGYSI